MSHDYVNSVEELIENKYLVSFEFAPQNNLDLWGFIIACNEEFTLVNQFNRDMYGLDGYALFFNRDISEYWVYTLDENYLETRYINSVGIEPIPQPQIAIKSIESALESISSHFELLNIYRDDLDVDVGTIIGSLSGVGAESFGLLPMRTDGVWKTIPGFFRLEDITRVDFGTKYLDVLMAVAGKRDVSEFVN